MRLLLYGILITLILVSMTPMLVHAAPHYTINLYSTPILTTAGYYALINATVSGAPHTVSFVVSGAHFTYDNATGVWEAQVRSSGMAVTTYTSLDSFSDPTEAGATATLGTTATVTWAMNPIDNLTAYTAVGDLPGLFYYFMSYQLGATLTATAIIAAISLAAYNYSGLEVTLLWWLLSWSVFSVMVSGVAQAFGVLILSLGGGSMLAQLILGRRDSG